MGIPSRRYTEIGLLPSCTDAKDKEARMKQAQEEVESALAAAKQATIQQKTELERHLNLARAGGLQSSTSQLKMSRLCL
jgi:hypothetical protein